MSLGLRFFCCASMLAVVPGFGGCNSTGVGNPGIASVSIAIVSDDRPEAGADGGALDESSLPSRSLKRAVLVLGHLDWLPCDEDFEPVSAPGPFVVDLLTGETEPEIPEVAAPPGGFCGIDAPLAATADSAALQGRSLLFSGVRADGTLFLVYADMKATLRVRASAGERWGDGEPAALLWAMRPRRWAEPMDLEEAEPTPWGAARRIIRIDVNRHPLLYAAIQARLDGRSSLFLDADRDGRLGSNEREQELGSGTADPAP